MSRHIPSLGVVALTALILASGCNPQQPFYVKNVDNELAYYKGVATEIEYPDVETERLPDVAGDKRPWSLQNMDTKNLWDLSLEEAMQIALANSKIIRVLNSPTAAPDAILRSPDTVASIYDPALVESDPRGGVEAALSAFDAQLSAALVWEKIDAPQNVNADYAEIGLYPNVDSDDMATFQTRVSKVTATGGTFALTHNVRYDLNTYNYPTGSTPTYNYAADWNVNLVAEARQPLLKGAGVQFNRINGPGTTSGPGNYSGVMIARVNSDMELVRFENNVQNLVSNVETAYWELYYRYRSLDAVVAGRDSALQTWRRIYTLFRVGGQGGEADKEAQARVQYYIFRSNAEETLNQLYATEANLRYLMGLAPTDGRLIRPKDEPTTAKIVIDWDDAKAEALVRNVSLRGLKFSVKRYEMELIASKNYLLPQLDAVAQYRWLGLGNYLLPTEDGAGSDFTALRSNAYQSLVSGQFQEWQAGFQFSMPFGFRKEHAGVRNAQLLVTKAKRVLQEGELELMGQLSHAIRDLEADYVLTQTKWDQRTAGQRQVEAVAAAYETGTITLDVLLKAQQELAVAESEFYRKLVDYNEAIIAVHLRKGSLLEYNGVYLAEGPWPGKAYFDARRRARARAASTYLDYGFTQPRVLSRGPINQHAGGDQMFETAEVEDVTVPGPTPAKKPAEQELVPTPVPEPAQSSMLPPEPLPPEPQAANGRPAAENVAWVKTRKSATTGATHAAAAPEPAQTDDHVTQTSWINDHESSAHPSAAADDRPASGWTRLQH